MNSIIIGSGFGGIAAAMPPKPEPITIEFIIYKLNLNKLDFKN